MPTLPSVPVPNNSSLSTFNLPKVPDAPAAPTLPTPTVDGKSNPLGKTTSVASSVPEAPPANPSADKPPVDPEAAQAGTSGTETSGIGAPGSLPPQGLPDLPMANAVGVPDAAIIPPALPMSLPEAAASLPEISVERAKPKLQTWQTRLAPAIVPPVTNFQYRRVLLPDAIYAAQYGRDNSHLPLRLTREDYQAMLFSVVAKNDIDGTRALLNAGTGLEVTNSAGETPLTVAKRSGAAEVTKLLLARGAK